MTIYDELDMIDRIQEARERNNKNWMRLVKLALRVAPKEAKDILAEIHAVDKEIGDHMIGIIPPGA